jgi:acylpyruvate hydrolase
VRLATLRLSDGSTRAAKLEGDEYVPLDASDVGEVLRRGVDEVGQVIGVDTIHAATANLAPVVVAPGKIICAGLNYRAHILEMGRPLPERPTLFSKFADVLTGPADDIPLGREHAMVDWEAELAVVVGSPLVRATASEAAAAIAGYTAANDVSMRDWQNHTSQWLPGKNFPRTTPVGPVLVTSDEFNPADGARITTSVNGEVMQDADVSDMVFDAAALLAYISTFTELHPGDIVLTGTPGGVGAGQEPPRFLADGDVVEVRIDGIGTLRNRFRSA